MSKDKARECSVTLCEGGIWECQKAALEAKCMEFQKLIEAKDSVYMLVEKDFSEIEAKLAECVAAKLDLNLKKTALLASLIRAVECLESVQASTNHPTTIMFIGEALDAIKQRHGELK